FFFVGGHRKGSETFRHCVIRETSEELGLAHHVDFRVGVDPVTLQPLKYVAYSQNAKLDTAYTMELFEVELLNNRARERVAVDPRNRWLTEQEISRLEAFDGRPVSVTMPMLLNMAGLLAR